MPSLPSAKAHSLPPHLRQKPAAVPNGSPQGRKLNATAASYQPSSLDSQYEAACEATRRVSDPAASETVKDESKFEDSALAWKMATVDLGVEDAKQVSSADSLLTHTNCHRACDFKWIC
jgi:hypothetical protein